MIDKRYTDRVRLLHRMAAGLVLFIAVQLISFITVCPQAEAAKPMQAQSRTVKLNVFSVKKHGKGIDWHRFLPRRYRKAYHVLQGSATDGKYVYLNYWNQKKDKCIMVKVKAKTLKKVSVSSPLKLYHGNDMAYNPSDKKLYVVYSDQKPFQVTIVDPKTLTIRGHKTVRIFAGLNGLDPGSPGEMSGEEEGSSAVTAASGGVSAGDSAKITPIIPGNTLQTPAHMTGGVTGFVGITYQAKKKLYAMRVAGKNDFVILDRTLKPLRYVKVKEMPGLRRQSMDCDEKYVYVCMDKAGSYNLIVVYDWEGRFVRKLRIPLAFEIEGMYHIGKKIYGAFYNTKGPSSYVYRLKGWKISK